MLWRRGLEVGRRKRQQITVQIFDKLPDAKSFFRSFITIAIWIAGFGKMMIIVDLLIEWSYDPALERDRLQEADRWGHGLVPLPLYF